MVSSILTVWADNDEITGLLFVKPVTSQRLKGTATLSSESLATQRMQMLLWSTGRECRGRQLDVFLLIHGRKEAASGCLPGVDSPRAAGPCSLKARRFTSKRLSGGSHSGPSFLSLRPEVAMGGGCHGRRLPRAEVARVVIRALPLSTLLQNLVICAHL